MKKTIKGLLAIMIIVSVIGGMSLPALAAGEEEATALMEAAQEVADDNNIEETNEAIDATLEASDPALDDTETTTQELSTQEGDGGETTADDEMVADEGVAEDENAEEAEDEETEEETDEAETSAGDGTVVVNGLGYRLRPDSMTAVLYAGEPETIGDTVAVPAAITTETGEVYRVTEIEAHAFYNSAYQGVRHVTLSEGLETIGYCAFYNVPATGTLVIPDSVTSVGDYAFGGGNYDRIIVGRGVTALGMPFMYNQKDFAVELYADNLQTVGYWAFYATQGKVTETIVHGEASLELYEAITNNTMLGASDVSFPDTKSLNYVKLDKMLYRIDDDGAASLVRFYGEFSNSTINVPAQITHNGETYNVLRVEDNAFEELRLAYAPVFAEGLISIGANAFRDVESWGGENILTIPNSVQTIGVSAFENTEVSRIEFGTGVKEIPSRAFAGMSNWGNPFDIQFRYGGRLETIASDAFAGTSVQRVTVFGPEGCMDDVLGAVPEFEGKIRYDGSKSDRNDRTKFETKTADGIRVVALVEKPALMPKDVELIVERVSEQAYYDELDAYRDWLAPDRSVHFTDENTRLHDIRFVGSELDEEGMMIEGEKTEYQPGKIDFTISVDTDNREAMAWLGNEGVKNMMIVHMHEGERPQRVASGEEWMENAVFLQFSVPSLSVFAMANRQAIEAKYDEAHLQDLIDAAENGGAVVLDDNFSLSDTVKVPAGKTVTLKTDGTKSVAVTGDAAPLFEVDGTLIVDDNNLVLQAGDKRKEITIAKVNGAMELKAGTINGGAISKAAIYVGKGASFAMSGGEIKDTSSGMDITWNAPVYAYNATVSMSGGVVHGNAISYKDGSTLQKDATKNSAGAFYLNSSSMELTGGSIENNKAGDAGGIFAIYDATLNMSGGEIKNNISLGQGGGVVIAGNGENAVFSGNTVFNMTGGTISGNHAKRNGGGIYVNSDGATLSGGRIEGNSAGNYGGGVYVSISPYALKMENVVITGNDASYQGGGVWCCPTGNARFFADRGVAIFDNHAERAADDFASNAGSMFGRKLEVVLDRRMLGGELVRYYTDGGFKGYSVGEASVDDTIPRFDPANPGNPVVVSGSVGHLALKAVATDQAKAAAQAAANLVITGNTAWCGGGVGTNGTAKISGNEPKMWTLNVEKEWVNVAEKHMPESIEVVLLIDDEEQETITLTAEKEWKGAFQNIPEAFRGRIAVREVGAEEGEFLVSYGEIVEDSATLSVKIVNERQKEEPVAVALSAKKLLDGKAPEDQTFTFTLSDEWDNVLQTKTNDGSEVRFDEIVYDEAGEYVYTVKEVAGDDAYITYDKTVYQATVTVTEAKAEDGTNILQANVEWTRDGARFAGETPEFNNLSHNPETTPARVRFFATKYLNGATPTGRTFTFTLSDENGRIVQRKTNSGAAIAFDEIIFRTEGEFKYTLREVKGNAAYVTYDDSVYVATVTVTAKTLENGNTELTATVTWTVGGAGYAGASPEFRNTYTPPENDTPPTTPENPTEPPQVLGVRRTDSESAVLGARRGKTGERGLRSNYAALVAAMSGLVMILTGKRKKKAE